MAHYFLMSARSARARARDVSGKRRTALGVAPSADALNDGVCELRALRCQRGMDVSIGTDRSHADSTERSSFRERDMAARRGREMNEE